MCIKFRGLPQTNGADSRNDRAALATPDAVQDTRSETPTGRLTLRPSR